MAYDTPHNWVLRVFLIAHMDLISVILLLSKVPGSNNSRLKTGMIP